MLEHSRVILLVSDDTALIKITAEMTEKVGLEYHHAKTVDEAESLLTKTEYRFVLLGIKVGEKTTANIINQLHHNKFEQNLNVPTIVMSQYFPSITRDKIEPRISSTVLLPISHESLTAQLYSIDNRKHLKLLMIAEDNAKFQSIYKSLTYKNFSVTWKSELKGIQNMIRKEEYGLILVEQAPDHDTIGTEFFNLFKYDNSLKQYGSFICHLSDYVDSIMKTDDKGLIIETPQLCTANLDRTFFLSIEESVYKFSPYNVKFYKNFPILIIGDEMMDHSSEENKEIFHDYDFVYLSNVTAATELLYNTRYRAIVINHDDKDIHHFDFIKEVHENPAYFNYKTPIYYITNDDRKEIEDQIFEQVTQIVRAPVTPDILLKVLEKGESELKPTVLPPIEVKEPVFVEHVEVTGEVNETEMLVLIERLESDLRHLKTKILDPSVNTNEYFEFSLKMKDFVDTLEETLHIDGNEVHSGISGHVESSDINLSEFDKTVDTTNKNVDSDEKKFLEKSLEDLKTQDINARNEYGHTALMLATRLENMPLVKRLIDDGGLVNVKAKNGKSVLHYAAQTGNLGLVELLVSENAKFNIIDNNKNEAIADAIIYGHPQIVQYFLSQGRPINKTNEKGQTYLMMAAHAGQLEIFNYLLNNGCNPDLKDKKGKSLIHYAKSGKNKNIIQVVRKFLKK